MAQPPVYIVHLRRPRMDDPNERRSDPFYEFGSFGCTGCHSRNLMYPKNIAKLVGARLVFAQGGPLGFRLVYLSPPINPRAWEDRTEARWSPAEMPFRYDEAPVLAYNGYKCDFPLIEMLARTSSRTTIEGGFSSLFRTRGSPLDLATAKEIQSVYSRLRKAAKSSAIARTYVDALPTAPPLPDEKRRATFTSLVKRLGDKREARASKGNVRRGGSVSSARRRC